MPARPAQHPIELQLAVLRFCPPSTLAVAGQVSFAWLQLSAPLLHRHVELYTQNRLARMFCSRDRPLHPDLERCLALSQINSLTLDQRQDPDDDPFPVLSLDRVPASTTLGLDRLTLRVFTDEHWDACRPIPQLLDPVHLRIEGKVLTTFYMDEFDWPNVRTVELVDAAVYPPIGRGRTHELELSSTFTSVGHPFFFDRWTRSVLSEVVEAANKPHTVASKFEVWVRTDEQRARVTEALEVERVSPAMESRVNVGVML